MEAQTAERKSTEGILQVSFIYLFVCFQLSGLSVNVEEPQSELLGSRGIAAYWFESAQFLQKNKRMREVVIA